jgi:hypothetical protein
VGGIEESQQQGVIKLTFSGCVKMAKLFISAPHTRHMTNPSSCLLLVPGLKQGCFS